jgi:hypothetical protein
LFDERALPADLLVGRGSCCQCELLLSLAHRCGCGVDVLFKRTGQKLVEMRLVALEPLARCASIPLSDNASSLAWSASSLARAESS